MSSNILSRHVMSTQQLLAIAATQYYTPLASFHAKKMWSKRIFRFTQSINSLSKFILGIYRSWKDVIGLLNSIHSHVSSPVKGCKGVPRFTRNGRDSDFIESIFKWVWLRILLTLRLFFGMRIISDFTMLEEKWQTIPIVLKCLCQLSKIWYL